MTTDPTTPPAYPALLSAERESELRRLYFDPELPIPSVEDHVDLWGHADALRAEVEALRVQLAAADPWGEIHPALFALVSAIGAPDDWDFRECYDTARRALGWQPVELVEFWYGCEPCRCNAPQPAQPTSAHDPAGGGAQPRRYCAACLGHPGTESGTSARVCDICHGTGYEPDNGTGIAGGAK